MPTRCRGKSPGQDVRQLMVDEALHTLMLGGALQKQLEGPLVPAVIESQRLE